MAIDTPSIIAKMGMYFYLDKSGIISKFQRSGQYQPNRLWKVCAFVCRRDNGILGEKSRCYQKRELRSVLGLGEYLRNAITQS